MSQPSVAVVVITRNRKAGLLENLPHLTHLLDTGEAAQLLVVDNGSEDGTADAVRAHDPRITVLPQRTNRGAAGRTIGARATAAPLVAFADDDSWWAPGALSHAAAVLDAHPRIGLLHARLVVEPEGIDDDVCPRLAAGPRDPALPGPSIIGHLACGVVVRRRAYLAAGGYSELLGFGGEERLLSLDLASAGWAQCYVPSVVAHHLPSPVRESWPERHARYRRNDTLTALLRLPAGWAAREAAELARQGLTDPAVRRELAPFARRLPAALTRRRTVPEPVLHQLRAATAPI